MQQTGHISRSVLMLLKLTVTRPDVSPLSDALAGKGILSEQYNHVKTSDQLVKDRMKVIICAHSTIQRQYSNKTTNMRPEI